jgi:hypothetical protein
LAFLVIFVADNLWQPANLLYNAKFCVPTSSCQFKREHVEEEMRGVIFSRVVHLFPLALAGDSLHQLLFHFFLHASRRAFFTHVLCVRLDSAKFSAPKEKLS